MHNTPKMFRSFVLAGICIIASVFIASGFNSSTDAFNDATEEPKTFKRTIAAKAVEEYNRWHRHLALRETDPPAYSILKQYWSLGQIAIPKDQQLANSHWQFRHPWSAVFISYVMQQAGAGSMFHYANAHAQYIVWAKENAKAADAVFAAYNINDAKAAWLEPGDLICLNRRGNKYTLQSIDTNCISHCDIVVAVNKEERTMITIGGNINQTVSKRIVYLDENGFIDTSKNWKVLDDEENLEGSQKQLFGVIKVKGGF
jgi:hypothetical protein